MVDRIERSAEYDDWVSVLPNRLGPESQKQRGKICWRRTAEEFKPKGAPRAPFHDYFSHTTSWSFGQLAPTSWYFFSRI